MFGDVAMSYQPENNVETTLKCLLGSKEDEKLIIDETLKIFAVDWE